MVGVKDIAEKAGVSMITVSRVINTPEKVSPKTRERIQKIMDEVGYVHNTVAHNLASGRSGIICIHVSPKMNMFDPFMELFLIGVSMELSANNYSITIVKEIKADRFCDGYIFTGYDPSSKDLKKCKETGKPIAIFGVIDDPTVDVVITDNVSSAKKVVSYLINCGHKKIACVLNDIKADYIPYRLEGYKEALSEASIDFDEKMVIKVSNDTLGGIEVANWYCSLEEKPSAIFFITDIMAVGFIMELQRRGIKVPDDVSVVGFDGLGNHLLSSPKVTTVMQPVSEIAKQLADCIINRVERPSIPYVHKLVDGRLLVEESVKIL